MPKCNSPQSHNITLKEAIGIEGTLLMLDDTTPHRAVVVQAVLLDPLSIERREPSPPVKYGYFEIKCKPMNSKASSAFWFYNTEPDIWTEIYVFEFGAGAVGHERTVHMNVHVFSSAAVFRTPTEKEHWSNGDKFIAPFNLAEDYHIYALEWDKDEIKWYVDGEIVRTIENTHWHQPLHMNFDSETMPEWFGLPEKESLPAPFDDIEPFIEMLGMDEA